MTDVRWKPATALVLRARSIVLANLHERDKGGGDSFGACLAAGLRDDSPEMRIALAAFQASLNWVSEAKALPRVGQSVLLATPRQSGEFWDIAAARLLVRHEGVAPLPVEAGGSWPTDYYWGRDHSGRDNHLITGNGWWAPLDTILLPPGAVHDTVNGYHCIRQLGDVYVPQNRKVAHATEKPSHGTSSEQG